jgi:hypothetical protein
LSLLESLALVCHLVARIVVLMLALLLLGSLPLAFFLLARVSPSHNNASYLGQSLKKTSRLSKPAFILTMLANLCLVLSSQNLEFGISVLSCLFKKVKSLVLSCLVFSNK